MESTDTQVKTSNLTTASKTDTLTFLKTGADSGYFWGWIKLVKTAGGIKALHIGWKLKGRDGYWRPFYVDTNRAAQNYDKQVYANFEDAGGAGVGLVMADGEWYPLCLFDPADPLPIPLRKGTDVIEVYLNCPTAAGADDFAITLELLTQTIAV